MYSLQLEQSTEGERESLQGRRRLATSIGRQDDEEEDVKLLESFDADSPTPCPLALGLKGGKGRKESKKAVRKLVLVLSISFTFMVVEFVGGGLARSVAIMTDAAHLLSDVCAFTMSAYASHLASKRSRAAYSFGYHRAEVIGALLSVLVTWAVTGMLVAEAVRRFISPTNVNGKLMFFLAIGGLVMNLILMFVLGHGHSHGGHDDSGHCQPKELSQKLKHHHDEDDHDHKHEQAQKDALKHGGHSHSRSKHRRHCSHGHDHENMSIRAAFIHILGDLVQSIGVVISGALIWWHDDDPKWNIADPISTFIFAGLVMCTTIRILNSTLDAFMLRAPRGHNIEIIHKGLSSIEGIQGVRDLHVWGLAPGIPVLSCCVVFDAGADRCRVLQLATEYCRLIGIDHSTIETQRGGPGATPRGLPL
ncbi:unnamed protein product [Ostreobium quekettii]|uniref:Cation efflux protein transmembrane domain-containing protein n=1 Tax=Ostreobium quekettii TaxID=121088 RepID=A0A8S1J0Y8_9CHLO|nr:unnamed protein product [Ostreobium quekettii]